MKSIAIRPKALNNINEARENATTQISNNKQEALNKKTIIIKTLIFLSLNKAC